MDKVNSNSKNRNIKEEKKNVQVFLRVRPVNDIERTVKSCSVVSCNGKELTVKERPQEKVARTFTFDRVFGPESKQIDVYKTVVRPLIEEVLAGYNCTVFAYGQTGTGKTFTMEGEKTNDPAISWENDPLSGIIPRSMSHLFDELRLLQAEYTIRVSFLELYNEELFDLLSPSDDTSKLRLYFNEPTTSQLFEDTTRKGSVIIQGLEEVTVHSKNEVYRIMERGSAKRNTAATLMNAQSSRSHTVFSITVHIKDNSVDGEELLKTGKLNLVDLAGSENIGRSGAVDKRAREAGNINQSLLTLGRVITSLVEHTPHVPYRESKLTRLLQDSLGGRTKTSIIATISPAACNLEETLSTLDYAHRAKNITNKPEINQKLTKRALLKEYTEEIERLKRDLEATREKNGVHIAPENYTLMIHRLEEQENEIMEKISTMKAIKEEMDKKEDLLSMLNMKLDKAKDIIHKTINERDESKHLIEKHKEVEKQLIAQALELQAAVNKSTNDNEKLHQKLETKYNVQDMNKQATLQFGNNYANVSREIEEKLSECDKKQNDFFNEQQRLFKTNLYEQEEMLGKIRNTVAVLELFIKDLHMDTEQFKEKNLYYQKTISEHQQSVNSLIQCGGKELKNISNIKFDVGSVLEYLKSVEESQSKLTRNTEKNNQILVEFSDELDKLKYDFTMLQEQARVAMNPVLNNLEDIQKFEEQHHSNISEHNNHMRKKLDDQENNMKLLMKCMENIISENTSIKKMISIDQQIQHKTDICSLLDQASSSLKELDETQQECTTDVANRLDDHRQKINQFANVMLNEIEDTLFQSETGINASFSTVMMIQEKIDKYTDKESNNLKNYENCWSCRFEGLSSNLHHELLDKETRTCELNNKMKSVLNDTDSHISKALSNNDTFCMTRCIDFEKETSQIGNNLNILRNCFVHQSNTVQNYMNNELKFDSPTGQTPPRLNLQYPLELAAMSPYDRILTRFRSTRSYNFENVNAVIDVIDGEKVEGSSVSEKSESDSEKVSNESGSGTEDQDKENASSLGNLNQEFNYAITPNKKVSCKKRAEQNGAEVLKARNVFKKPYQKK